MLQDLTIDLNEAKTSHKKTLNEANAIREKENKQNQLAGEKLAIAHKNGMMICYIGYFMT